MFSLTNKLTFILSFALIMLFASYAGAQNLKSVKSSMLERKDAISALKEQGAVGEGIDGYLHVRRDVGGAGSVANAENADRRVVYESIAKRQNIPVAQVASRRGIKLAEIAQPGQWLRKGNGAWYTK